MALWTVRRALARWLHRWAVSILPEEDREVSPALPPAEDVAAEPEPDLFLSGGGGPPAHWVELVRHAAPELLLPAEGLPPQVEDRGYEQDRPSGMEPAPPARFARPAPPAPPPPDTAEKGRPRRDPHPMGEEARRPGAVKSREAREFPRVSRSRIAESPHPPTPSPISPAPAPGRGGATTQNPENTRGGGSPSPPGRGGQGVRTPRDAAGFSKHPVSSGKLTPDSHARILGSGVPSPEVWETVRRREKGSGGEDSGTEQGRPPFPVERAPSPVEEKRRSPIEERRRSPVAREGGRVVETRASTPPPLPAGAFSARVETAPVARPARQSGARRWPSLPEPPRDEPEEPAAERAAVRSWERRQRLDREQQRV
jgi:hypothetical protein